MCIIGIDFGTSKSVVSRWEAGQPRIIPDGQGHRTMPSLVMVAPDERLYVGWEALSHPDRYQSEHFTISSVKRLMGKIAETTWGRFRTYPQEISALILANLKFRAEASLGAEVSDAVIAVPAHFDINQRWATMEAAEIAGLRPQRLVNEATAALLGYSQICDKKEGLALVFDFGGGTLDVSVVEFGDGVYEVKATHGDDRLGGDDFDSAIIEYVLDKMKQQVGKSLELDQMRKLVLKESATRAKIALSTALSTRIRLPGFLGARERHYCDLDVVMERTTFEGLSSGLFQRAEAALRTVIRESGVAKGGITDLLLVGGSGRIPRIRELVSTVTGLEPRAGFDSATIVAEGAAIEAAILSGEGRGDLVFLDALPSTYSVATMGDKASPVIQRNTTLPTHRGQIFTTTEDNQTEITIRVFQGESHTASENTFVGEVRLHHVLPAPAGTPQIEVVFDVDANETLNIQAHDVGTGEDISLMMEAPYRLNQAQIKVLQKKVRQELESARRRAMEARERVQNEVAKRAAKDAANVIDHLLAMHRDEVGTEQAGLLTAGKEIILDSLRRGVSYQHLQTVVSSVRHSYKDAMLTVLFQTARSVSDSEAFSRWLDDAARNVRSPALLEESFQEFALRFRGQIDSISRLLRGEKSDVRIWVEHQLLHKATDSPEGLLCLAMIVSRFAGVHLTRQGLTCDNPRAVLLHNIILFGELGTGNPKAARRAAAEAIFHAYKGTPRSFLCDYVVQEADPEVRSWLERCLGGIPAGVWFKGYGNGDPSKREWFKGNAVALRELRLDLLHVLKDFNLEAQLAAVQTFQEVGVTGCLGDLITLIRARSNERVKIGLISLLAGSPCKAMIVPLLKTLCDDSASVRCAAAAALDGCSHLMSADFGRLCELAHRIIKRGSPITCREKFFLWKFARKHKELRAVARTLKKRQCPGTRPR